MYSIGTRTTCSKVNSCSKHLYLKNKHKNALDEMGLVRKIGPCVQFHGKYRPGWFHVHEDDQ